MKTLKIGVLGLALVASQVTFAANNPPPPDNAAPYINITGAAAPAALALDPDTIRVQLLESNLSLIEAVQQVKDAKDQVSVGKFGLFPALNLGGLVGLNVGTFLLSTVQFLVPFLSPSNWFNYHADKDLFQADKYSYQALQLNTYSSALSLYLKGVADQEAAQAYAEQAADLKKIYDNDAEEVKLGIMASTDILQVEAQYKSADAQAKSQAQAVDQDVASMRMTLGLPLSTKLTFTNKNIAASTWEGKDLQTVVDQADAIAPEHQQIQFLVMAAKSKKWSTTFSFLNNFTLSSQVVPGVGPSNVSLSNMYASQSGSLGLQLFPEIKIAARNIEEQQLLDTQFVQSNTNVIESTVTGLTAAKAQLDSASQSETEMEGAYKAIETKYEDGIATITDLLVGRTQMTSYTIARITAQLNINLLRVVLNRSMIENQFSLVKGCAADTAPNQKNLTLDQICRGQEPSAAANN